ncbi:hypothetical protein [uncultured Lentibacter sp.]|jgi:hypothetical protein|uniref:hypothetical protein n=1 Tax=uncultured Lentibacter sp. TaxID=1659309 RepID=UPI0026398ED5|nr:hypothetical protein [uncultured Lentibacter sp.]
MLFVALTMLLGLLLVLMLDRLSPQTAEAGEHAQARGTLPKALQEPPAEIFGFEGDKDLLVFHCADPSEPPHLEAHPRSARVTELRANGQLIANLHDARGFELSRHLRISALQTGPCVFPETPARLL